MITAAISPFPLAARYNVANGTVWMVAMLTMTVTSGDERQYNAVDGYGGGR